MPITIIQACTFSAFFISYLEKTAIWCVLRRKNHTFSYELEGFVLMNRVLFDYSKIYFVVGARFEYEPCQPGEVEMRVPPR